MHLILFNKPCRVLCQFSDNEGRKTLADYIDRPGVYPAGRLDFETEGLVMVTDDGRLQARISDPRHKLPKHYWAQVEGVPSVSEIGKLSTGVSLKDGSARALTAEIIPEPAGLWDRSPPIRYRKNKPTAWLNIAIDEGRNRQVRRMTAAIGFPTLRLIRHQIGPWGLDALLPGDSLEIKAADAWQRLKR